MSLRMLARRSVLALGVVVIAELGVFSAATRVAAQDGEPGADQADDHVRQALAGENAPAAVAKESEAVPAGEIHVHVLDEADAAVASAAVEVGTLGQGGKREKVEALTDSNGVAVFKGLPTGSVQAYRVNVPHQGAVYSSTPFQLPPNHGYEVTVHRREVSTDSRFILQFLMRVYFELRDGRVRVVEQSQLVNLGRATYVFPKDGLEVVLPEGRQAFQTQASMGDQHISETDAGLKITGSVPPGRVTMMWAFDMPLAGDTFHFKQTVPFRTYRFSIEADGPPGAKLEVAGMPQAIVHEEKGNRFLVTQTQIEPTETQLGELDVTLTGLPGPGPTRWIAVAGAAIFVLLAGFLAWRRPGRAAVDAGALDREKETVLEELEALEKEFRAGEVGPKFHAARQRELTDELAILLKSAAENRN